MQKKSLLILSGIFSFLLLINLISAYYYGYDYGALSNFLDSIDASTMILVSVFIISFVLLHFSLSHVFKRENKASAGILSFVLSLLITYGINRSGFNFEGFFYNIGISGDFLYSILPLILIGLIIFLGVKFSFSLVLILFGILFVITSFTDIFYEKGIIFILGMILFIVGLVWQMKKSKNEKNEKDVWDSFLKRKK
jgi:hypothetical protein